MRDMPMHGAPDHCPMCGHEITGGALARGLRSGDEWTCPVCWVDLEIEEHTDGFSDWMTFHRTTEL